MRKKQTWLKAEARPMSIVANHTLTRTIMCGRGGANVSLCLLIILIVAHHIWNFLGLISWNWAGLEPMQTSSVFLAAKPASAPVRVRSLYTSRTPSTANDPNSMAAAAPKWAQKTITLPPQRRGCHLITPKVHLFPHSIHLPIILRNFIYVSHKYSLTLHRCYFSSWRRIAFHFYRYGNEIFCFELAIPVSSKHPLKHTQPFPTNLSLYIWFFCCSGTRFLHQPNRIWFCCLSITYFDMFQLFRTWLSCCYIIWTSTSLDLLHLLFCVSSPWQPQDNQNSHHPLL